MFDELLKIVSLRISTIRATIETNDKLRDIVFQDNAITQKLKENAAFSELIEVVPNQREWLIYDYCSVVTRLYAIYERFAEDLIANWLQILPISCENYLDLGEKIQNTHRQGVGRLLSDLNKNRFQHLSVEKVVQGLFSGITSTGKYELLPEAFLLHEQNLRKEVLEKLFADAGIENAWKWVTNHRKIKHFVEEIRGYQNTVEGELKQLIDYRNEAAHGTVDEILGTQELLDLGDFVEALCKALAELVTYHVILRQASVGQAKEIGKITEWYKKSQAVVAKVEDIELNVGESLFLVLVNDKVSYCYLAKIESIKINDISKNRVEIDSEAEVGLKFDTDARKGLTLYKCNQIERGQL
ncbi:MAG: MAE_28990/MAE_18760 family HEPN-like nuclease [Cyanobacteriota bacterium]|nr:MAE_28990/MAE_18760 family HEPN-like nuclease [Cyanobacteriota bacterium]